MSSNLKPKWPQRLFGQQLIKCDAIETTTTNEVNCSDCFQQSQSDDLVTVIYFSFANIGAQSDDVTKHLITLYNRMNNNGAADKKRMEVVQVVLWANNDVFDDFEQSHRNCIEGMPWYAVPFHQIQLKTRLSRRYHIKAGVPTLVLLDSDGTTITCSGKERLVEDPLGDSFPWRPRPIDQILKDVELIPGGSYPTDHPDSNDIIKYEDLRPETIRGFYFSAHWCPPCRAFTPQLIDMYRRLRTKGEQQCFEVIFISSDRSDESFNTYLEAMPWLAIPWQQTALRAELAQLYGVRGIPTLLLVDSNGHVITNDARAELIEDPFASNFPWKPRPVNVLTERYVTKLQDYPAVILFIEDDESEIQFAETVLTPIASTYYQQQDMNFSTTPTSDTIPCKDETDSHHLKFLIGVDSETTDTIRDVIGIDDSVPILVAIDIPNERYAIMEQGQEITSQTVRTFVERFQNGDLDFQSLSRGQSLPKCGDGDDFSGTNETE